MLQRMWRVLFFTLALVGWIGQTAFAKSTEKPFNERLQELDRLMKSAQDRSVYEAEYNRLISENLAYFSQGVRQTQPAGIQVVLASETFDTAIPTGWTVQDSAGTVGSWEHSTANATRCGGAPSTTANPNIQGGFLIVDSDCAGSSSITRSELITTAYNFSTVSPTADLNLSFDYLWRFVGDELGDVDVSVNNGAWVNLLRLNNVPSTPNPRGATALLNLNAYRGQSNVRIRFYYYKADWDYYWIIDNFRLVSGDVVSPTITHTPLGNTTNTAGPYVVTATVRDNIAINADSTKIYYSTDGGTVYTLAQNIQVTGAADTLKTVTGNIPGQPGGTGIRYYIRTKDQDGNSTQTSVYSFSVLLQLTLPFITDFETPGPFVEQIIGGTASAWRHGSVTNPSGPTAAHSGTRLWGTGLAANYPNSLKAALALNGQISLAGQTTILMSFWHWYNLETGWDGGNVKISTNGGTTWTVLVPDGGYPTSAINSMDYGTSAGGDNQAGYSGISGGGTAPVWVEAAFNLSAYAGQTVQLRFDSASDGSDVMVGWFIDDLKIYSPPVLDNAILQTPTATVPSNQTVSPLRAAVYEAGVTSGIGAGAGITAEFGYGDSLAAFVWSTATYSGDTNDGGDVYEATIPTQCFPGTKKYAFRFKLTQAGLTSPTLTTAQGTLTITGAPAPSRLFATNGMESSTLLSWLGACDQAGQHEIRYDDNIRDGGRRVLNAGEGTAVRFIPAAYPVTVHSLRLSIANVSGAACAPTEFHVWAGTPDGPGADLITPFTVTPCPTTRYNLVEITFPQPVTITSGDFFIGTINPTAASNFMGIDATAPSFGNSWFYFPGSFGWINLEDYGILTNDAALVTTEFIYRARVTYPAVSGPVARELAPAPAPSAEERQASKQFKKWQSQLAKGLITSPATPAERSNGEDAEIMATEFPTYNVYRSTTPNFNISGLTPVGTSTATVYYDFGLENGTTYYYKVAAQYATQGASASTNEAGATPQDQTPPVVTIDSPFWFTSQTTGTYTISATITDNEDVNTNSVWLYYSVNNEQAVRVLMPVTGSGSTVHATATIPAQALGWTVDYYVEASDMTGNMNESEVVHMEVVTSQDIPFSNDFEANNGNFFEVQYFGFNPAWQWGNPTAGPRAGHSGAKVWGTGLTGPYVDDELGSLVGRFFIDLTDAVDPSLSFYHWYKMEDRAERAGWDGGNVKISTDGGVNWELLMPQGGYPADSIFALGSEPGYTGISGTTPTDTAATWLPARFDLNNFKGHEVIIAFNFGSDGSVTEAGWFVDDVVIKDPAPNLVGDIESELIGGSATDWNNSDATTDFADADGDGIWTLTKIAASAFTSASGSGYQAVLVGGHWETQVPAPGGENIPVQFSAGQSVTFSIDTGLDPTWSPSRNVVYDNTKLIGTHTWTVVGPWQGWNPAAAATAALDNGQNGDVLAGDNLFTYERVITAADAAAGLTFKAARDGAWAYQIGSKGYSANGDALAFSAQVGDRIRFEVDATKGRIRATKVPYNIYGAMESELTGGAVGDLTPNDGTTQLTIQANGAHTYTRTAGAAFAWGPGYRLVPNGNTNVQYPPAAEDAMPIMFNAGQSVTVTMVSKPDSVDGGWVPAMNYHYNSVYTGMANDAANSIFKLVGSWTASPITLTRSGNYYMYEHQFAAAANLTYYVTYDHLGIHHYEFGANGLCGGRATPVALSVQAGERVRFMVDPQNARIRALKGPFEGDVLISEFSTHTGRIELRNTVSLPITLTGWTLNWNGGSYTLGEMTLAVNGYADVNISGSLPTAGAVLTLRHANGTLIDQVGYGTMGGAPAPISGWSTALIHSMRSDATEYNLDPTPTFGAMNDAAETAFSTDVVINELKPGASGFVELYNNTHQAIDLGGWVIVVDNAYVIPAGTMLAAHGFYTLSGAAVPAGMFPDTTANTAYLHNATTARVFQFGWSALRRNQSIGLVPDGEISDPTGYNNPTGTVDGYQVFNAATPGEANDSDTRTPTSLAANANFGRVIVLTWNLPAAAQRLLQKSDKANLRQTGPAEVAGVSYRIWRKLSSDALYTEIGSSSTPVYVDNDAALTVGASYNYMVSALFSSPDGTGESNFSNTATATFTGVAAQGTLLIDADGGTTMQTGLAAALTAANNGYLMWDVSQYGGYERLNLADFSLVAWEAGAADVAYNTTISTYAANGGNVLIFAPGLTGASFITNSAAATAATSATGSSASALSRNMTLGLTAGSRLTKFGVGANTTAIFSGATGETIGAAYQTATSEVVYLGFSSAAVSSNLNTFISKALLWFSDDTAPTLNAANVQPASGAFVKGTTQWTFPVADPNLDRFMLTIGAHSIERTVANTTPGNPDANGIVAYYDAANGRFVAQVNTALETGASSRLNSRDRKGDEIAARVWADGAYNLSLHVYDAVDNHSMYTGNFTVDNTLPTLGSFTTTPEAVNGIIRGNAVFSLPSADANMQKLNVTVQIVGGATYPFEYVVGDPNTSRTFTGNIGVTGLGFSGSAWTFTAANWPDGDFRINASATDKAGNVTSFAAPAAFRVDGQRPIFTTSAFDPANNASLSGQFNVTWPLVEANPTGLTVAVTYNGAAFLNFSGQAGTTLQVANYGIRNIRYENGAWRFTINTLVNDGLTWAQGNYQFRITAGDAVGNTSDQVTVTYHIEQQGLQVFFRPNPDTMVVGAVEERTVQLMIQDAINLYGYSVEFTFDPAHIQILDVTEGAFLGGDGAGTSFVRSFDNGRLSIANSRLGAAGGITQPAGTSATIATVFYRAQANTPMTIGLTTVQTASQFRDPQLQPIDAQAIPSFNLIVRERPTPPWWNKADFDHSCVVDGLDLIGLSYSFGATTTSSNWNLPNPPFREANADIASPAGQGMFDGKVNSSDLAWFGLNFGDAAGANCIPAGVTNDPAMGATASASLEVQPSALLNEPVAVDVYLTSAAALHGASLSLSYDPAALDLVGVEKADLFGANSQLLHRVEAGRIELAAALFGDLSANVTEGKIARLVFRPRQATPTDVRLDRGVAADMALNLARLNGAAVTISAKVLPTTAVLYQNHPNPFNPATTIAYALPTAAKVSLTIYTANGQKVKTLVNTAQDAGFYDVRWDGTNDLGMPVSSGVYFYTLQTGATLQTQKMLMLK